MNKKMLYLLIIVAVLAMGARTAVEIKTMGIVSKTEGNRYVYSLNSNANLYYRIYDTRDNVMWDTSLNAGAGGFAAPGSVTWSNSAISCTDSRTTVGGWLVAIPATLPDGGYDIVFYNNATPASSDTVLLGRWGNVKGALFQSFNDL